MIDTVVFRIHKLKEKYEQFAHHLQNISKQDDRVFKYNTKDIFKDDVKTFQHYSDTARVRFLSLRSAVYVASSHYNVVYNTNYERDFIEINMSVPKYIFGTNIMQFTDHREIDISHIWNKFERFCNAFFLDIFPMSPDYRDIEINRIDLCFNQIFGTKEDALKYLGQQKTLQLYHARSDKNRFSSYGGKAITYVTANYSFKIYHKGTEFRKNDLRELVKYNPNNYDLKELGDIADNILRYEITFRKGGLNYVHRQVVMDDPNTWVNHNLERLLKSKMKANREYLQNKAKNKNFGFALSSPWDESTAPLSSLTNSDFHTFNYELFFGLYDFFKKRVDVYQLNKKLTPDEMMKKIDSFIETQGALNNKKFDKSNIVVLATLTQYVDYKDLKEILPQSTFYRNQKLLKDVGISLNTIDNIYTPPIDFSEYFNLLGKYHVNYN